jgi:hypothetical protein
MRFMNFPEEVKKYGVKKTLIRYHIVLIHGPMTFKNGPILSVFMVPKTNYYNSTIFHNNLIPQKMIVN